MWFKRVSVIAIISILALISKYKSKGISSNLGQDAEVIDKIDIDMDELNKNTNDDDNNLGLTPEELMKLAVKEVEAAEEYEEQRKNKPQMANRGSIKRIYKAVPKNTSMKSWMDYRAITSKNSPQHKLQRQSNVYTDSEGFRRIGDDYIIAIGSYYTKEIGVRVEIKLSSGSIFTATIGDCKADIHTDALNQKHISDGSMLEFLVDSRSLNKKVKKMGDCSYANDDKFKGEVVSIVILEEEE